MNILVFQHHPKEGPGQLGIFAERDGHNLTTVNFDQNELPPPLKDYDALWVMGGGMNVWQEEEYPWLVDEKNAIREAINVHEMPYLGICLGHQLLADALGGKVGLADRVEVGIINIDVNSSSGIFAGLPPSFPVLQWHEAEVIEIPAQNAEIIANSTNCKTEALKINNNAFSFQFHLEAVEDTVDDWINIPEYSDALIRSIGIENTEPLREKFALHTARFSQQANIIYENWIRVISS